MACGKKATLQCHAAHWGVLPFFLLVCLVPSCGPDKDKHGNRWHRKQKGTVFIADIFFFFRKTKQ